jgi:hypothetical protein
LINNNKEVMMVFLKGILVWLGLMVAETIHGTARTLWLAPHMGDLPSRQVSFFTGVILILAIATLFIRWLHASNAQLLGIGILWAVLTLAFETGLGRLMGYSWERILEDYNLLRGGLMSLGLVLLVFSPLIAARLRSVASSSQ